MQGSSQEIVMSKSDRHDKEGPDDLLLKHLNFFSPVTMKGPVLDLACGNGHNGVFLATMGLEVELADVSERVLAQAAVLAKKNGVVVRIRQVDLEQEESNPLASEAYGAILVFRYLHRPLIPFIRDALVEGGLLLYETFTVDQPRFGKPKNPDHLLKPGELLDWFKEWHVLHLFEGIQGNPERSVAQIVCIKPTE
jgi:tellurite methyltransferase